VKPLTRYALDAFCESGDAHCVMGEHIDGQWYAKDEADAVIQRQSDTIQELGLRNAELEAERDKLSDAWDSLMQTASEQLVELAQLRAERDAARADAERYRWLRQRNEAIKGIDPPGPYVVEDEGGETHYPGGTELDAAIDAARSKE